MPLSYMEGLWHHIVLAVILTVGLYQCHLGGKFVEGSGHNYKSTICGVQLWWTVISVIAIPAPGGERRSGRRKN